MKQYFNIHCSAEGREIYRFEIGQGGPPEGMRQQQQAEQIREYFRTGDTANAVNRRMNTTGERLGKSRQELLRELAQQYRYISQLIDTMRTHFKRDARYQRMNVRGAMAISPRYGGGMGPMGLERRLEAGGAADRMGYQFMNLQQLEMERDQLKFKMAQLHAENVAGMPDNVSAVAPEVGTAQVNDIQIMTTDGNAQARFDTARRFRENAPAETVEAVEGLELELQEVAERLYQNLEPAEQKSMQTFALKMADQEPETLRKYFELYYKDGAPVDPESVTIDPADATAVKAKEFMESLTPTEASIAGKFLREGLAKQEQGETFAELSPDTQARIQKYAKRWNKAKPDSAQRLIAEGMMCLDGVDVESSLKNGQIDEKDIHMLPRESRLGGFISGIIKLAMGWKKLMAGFQSSEISLEKKDPTLMTKEERQQEVSENNTKITDLQTEQTETLPKEIERLKKELEAPGITEEQTTKLKEEIKKAEDRLAAIPNEIAELQARNEALKAVTENVTIPESQRVAHKAATEKVASIKAKYGVPFTLNASATQNYDRSIVVLQKLETVLEGLDPTQRSLMTNAVTNDGGTEVFTMENVSLKLKTEDGEAVTIAENTLKNILTPDVIAQDPNVRFSEMRERVATMLKTDFKRYVEELKTNPLIQKIAEKSGVDIESPEFQQRLDEVAKAMPEFFDLVLGSTMLEKNNEGNYRVVIDLEKVSGAIGNTLNLSRRETAQMISNLREAMEGEGLTSEGNNLVTPYQDIDTLLQSEGVRAIMEPIEKEPEGPIA